MLTASGNVLANDTDTDGATVAVGGNAGVYFGAYGTLMLAADGSYSYMLNNAAPAVQGLAAGESVADLFGYDVFDGFAGAGAADDRSDRRQRRAGDRGRRGRRAGGRSAVARGNVLDNDTDVDFEAGSPSAWHAGTARTAS